MFYLRISQNLVEIFSRLPAEAATVLRHSGYATAQRAGRQITQINADWNFNRRGREETRRFSEKY